eukprot:6655824-Alexandrium_andersonii.AAC.1
MHAASAPSRPRCNQPRRSLAGSGRRERPDPGRASGHARTPARNERSTCMCSSSSSSSSPHVESRSGSWFGTLRGRSSGALRGHACPYPPGSSHAVCGRGGMNPGRRSSSASPTPSSTGPGLGGTRTCP